MQNCPLSVMFGLGHMATAAANVIHMCNHTHEIVMTPGLYVRSSKITEMPLLQTMRSCHVSPTSWLGKSASLKWKHNVMPKDYCGNSPCLTYNNKKLTYLEDKSLLTFESNSYHVKTKHKVGFLQISGNDIWLIGGKCMTSVGSSQTVCVDVNSFETTYVDSTNDAVYLMNADGDVYVSHHVEQPVMQLQNFLQLPKTTKISAQSRLLTKFVAATEFLNSSCFSQPLGEAVSFSVDTTLLRHFDHASVSTPVHTPTESSVWLPYLPAPHTLCDILPQDCDWYQYYDGVNCVPRRPCSSIRQRPTRTSDYVCGNVEVKRERVRRQATTCVQTVAPQLTCDSQAATNECVRRITEEQRALQAEREGISSLLAIVTSPAPACANTSYLLGNICIPCSECGMGAYLADMCTPTADTICRACPKDTYMPDSWHTNRHCLITNGCPGSTRFENGTCGKEGYNYNTLWALVLPIYAVAFSRYQNILRKEVSA